MTDKLGKCADEAIDVEEDDFVEKATTFKSVDAALRGVKGRQRRRTEYVRALNNATGVGNIGMVSLWGGRRLGEINASQQMGRVIESGTIELLDSSSDEDNDGDVEKASIPWSTTTKKDSVSSAQKMNGTPLIPGCQKMNGTTPVILELLDDSSDDDEVQLVDPPPGYVPPPRKHPPIQPVPPAQRKQPPSIQPDSTKSYAPETVSSLTTTNSDDEIALILKTPNFIGPRRDLKPGQNLSTAIEISGDERKLSDIELKELQERREFLERLAAGNATKAAAANGNGPKVNNTAVLQNKPQSRRRRTAQSIVNETHGYKTLVPILKPQSFGIVPKAQSIPESDALDHSSLETKTLITILKPPETARAASLPNTQQLPPAINATSRKRPTDDATPRNFDVSAKVARGMPHQTGKTRQEPQPISRATDQQETRQFDQPKPQSFDQQKLPLIDHPIPIDQSLQQPMKQQFHQQAQHIKPLDKAPEQKEYQGHNHLTNGTTVQGQRYHSPTVSQLPLKRSLDHLTTTMTTVTAKDVKEHPWPRNQHQEPPKQPLDDFTPTPPVEQLTTINMLEKLSDAPDSSHSWTRSDLVGPLQSCPDDNHDDGHDVIAFESGNKTPELVYVMEELKKVAPEPDLARTSLPTLLPENGIADDCIPNSSSNTGNQSFRHFFEDDPLVEDTTYPGAIYSACRTEVDEIDRDLPAFMEPIEHLSEYTIGRETGLPEWTFYVHGADDHVLYKLKAFAAPSNIQGAQNGAFISFLGAYTLNSAQEERNRELDELVVDNHDRKPITTEAIMPDGIRVSVTIIGADLYEDYELRPQIAITRQPIVAKIPPGAPSIFEKTQENIRLVGTSIHDVHRKHNKRLEKKLNEKGLHPFGRLGTNVLTDYEFDNTMRKFQIPNCIDLGCYGPFIRSRKSIYMIHLISTARADLKVDDVFAIKSFIFQQNPNEWGFAVEDIVHGQELTVDITDDRNGLPSDIASFYIPMYDRDGLSINESIELYTNYKSGFESVRERRGYGKRNVLYGLPSDGVLVARLERNFSSREDAANELRMTAIEDAKEETMGLFRLFDFLRDEWSLLFPKEGTESTMQTVALRRLSWLALTLAEIVDGDVPIDQSLKVLISEWITTVTIRGTKMFRNIFRSAQSNLGDAFECLKCEIIEEVLYKVRNNMPLLMDENLYCAVARDLIEDLCIQYCESRSTGKDPLEAFVKLGLAALEKIRECAVSKNGRACLTFVSQETEGTLLYGQSEDILRKVSGTDAFYVQHTTFSKGVLAAVSKMKLEPDHASSFVEKPVSHNTVMVKLCNQLHRVDERITTLCSIPVDANSSDYEENVEWYIYWQVVWVLHNFSQKFSTWYDIQWLCKELGVDPTLALFVTQRGVRHYSKTSFDDVLLTKGKSRKTKRTPKKENKPLSNGIYTTPRTGGETISQRPSAKLVYEGAPTTSFPGVGAWPPGWTQKTYERASGASRGGTDHYWYPPDGRKLRSYKEIQRYLAKLH